MYIRYIIYYKLYIQIHIKQYIKTNNIAVTTYISISLQHKINIYIVHNIKQLPFPIHNKQFICNLLYGFTIGLVK
jgi:hypothetical protein